MLGFSLGVLHLSYDDFCRCTPSEFDSICDAFHSHEEAKFKDGWERTRATAVAGLRPYIKGGKSAKDIYPLPWDSQSPKENVKTLTLEEDKQRFEELLKRGGRQAAWQRM